MIEPKPWVIIIMPSVAMKGGSLRRETSVPLMKPTKVAMITMTTRQSQMLTPLV